MRTHNFLTVVLSISFVLGAAGVGTAWAADFLSGDTRLACEAILCLSSPARPGECSPALSRYFGISKKRWSDTVKARKNFLTLCPASSEKPEMQTLADALANGAGKCDAEQLNARGRWVEKIDKADYADCRKNRNLNLGNYTEAWAFISDDYEGGSAYCRHTVRYWIVDKTPPQYCRTIWQHQNTWFDEVQFVDGRNPWEGRWVENK